MLPKYMTHIAGPHCLGEKGIQVTGSTQRTWYSSTDKQQQCWEKGHSDPNPPALTFTLHFSSYLTTSPQPSWSLPGHDICGYRKLAVEFPQIGSPLYLRDSVNKRKPSTDLIIYPPQIASYREMRRENFRGKWSPEASRKKHWPNLFEFLRLVPRPNNFGSGMHIIKNELWNEEWFSVRVLAWHLEGPKINSWHNKRGNKKNWKR